MDVCKEGMLYLHGVKFGKKTWRKIWMVLFQPQTGEIGRLVLYSLPESDDNDDVSNQVLPPEQKKAERRVLRLCDCLSITLAPEEACPAGCRAFYLDTTLRTYTLASESCQDWFHALCQISFQDPGDEAVGKGNGLNMKQNDLYSDLSLNREQYPVTIMDTEASQRCQLAGEFVLLLDEESLFLLDKDAADVIYRWPYRFLRRFGKIKGGCCIEAGHRCDSGEGMFAFLSHHGSQVCQAIARICFTEQSAKASSSTQEATFHEGSLNCFDNLTVRSLHSSNSEPIPPVSKAPDISIADHPYATINHNSELNIDRQPCPLRVQRPWISCSQEDEGDGNCRDGSQFLDAVNQSQKEPGRDFSESNYSLVNFSGVTCGLQTESTTPPHVQSLPGAATHVQTLPYSPPKPVRRPLNQSRVPVKEEEETRKVEETDDRYPSVPEDGHPISFKQKLSNMISKDLAKLQLPRRLGNS